MAWAATQRGRPRIWGETDCGALARAALTEMFGEDVFPALPHWTSPRAALAVLEMIGSVEQLLQAAGAVPTTLPFLRAGDIVIIPDEEERVGRAGVFVCVDGQEGLGGGPDGVLWGRVQEPDARVYSLWEVERDG